MVERFLEHNQKIRYKQVHFKTFERFLTPHSMTIIINLNISRNSCINLNISKEILIYRKKNQQFISKSYVFILASKYLM